GIRRAEELQIERAGVQDASVEPGALAAESGSDVPSADAGRHAGHDRIELPAQAAIARNVDRRLGTAGRIGSEGGADDLQRIRGVDREVRLAVLRGFRA